MIRKLFDSIFGKKIVLEIPNGKGNIVEKKISRKILDKLVAAGKIKIPDMVEAHILDPIRGYYVTEWEIGKEISRENIEKFASPSGKVYGMVYYEKGKPHTLIAKKEVWEKWRSIIFEPIKKGEIDSTDAQYLVEEFLKDLERKIRDSKE